MKIAQVVCTLPPYGGGIGVVAHYYSNELVEHGHEVVVFAPCSKKRVPQRQKYKIVQLRPVVGVGNAAFLPQLLWRLRDFDIVHFHVPFVGATLYILLLKVMKRSKINLVLSYHMDLVGHGLKKRVFDHYNKTSLRGVIQRADKIIVSSFDYIQNSRIQKLYEKYKKKFVEIPFGVRKAFFPTPKNPSLLSKYKIGRDESIIGFVGGLDSAHYFKGVEYLITAISKIENKKIKAMIVGEGNLKKKYMDLAKNLGVLDRIIFAGYVEKTILPEHFNLFDIFALPSIDQSEAFGLVLLEAMACGKPLIASNLKGVRSVVIPGKNGLLIEPKNPTDLANKITHLLDNPDLMKQFAINGLEIVKNKYRWPIVVEQVEQVYQSIVGKK
jgi:glycosyltransferase involved in cell wall biosynthesis